MLTATRVFQLAAHLAFFVSLGGETLDPGVHCRPDPLEAFDRSDCRFGAQTHKASLSIEIPSPTSD